MRLLIVRHAIAEDRTTFLGNDDDRPLTVKGMQKMRRGARGLAKILRDSPAQILVSPLSRAQQTAEILQRVWPETPVATAQFLRPDSDVKHCVRLLAKHSRGADDFLAVVGHEPQLSELIAFLLGGTKGFQIELKKGGACLLEFHDKPRAAQGHLIWHVPPRFLRSVE